MFAKADRMEVKGPKILAKSFFRELRENGYDTNQILAVSTELIDLVTRELKGEDDGEAVTAHAHKSMGNNVLALPKV